MKLHGLRKDKFNKSIQTKKEERKKYLFKYSLQNTSVPKIFPETVIVSQGTVNASCHHSHPLKCTLDSREGKLGQGKIIKQNKTKPRYNPSKTLFSCYFHPPRISKEKYVHKPNQFSLPMYITYVHLHTHTHKGFWSRCRHAVSE